MGTFIIDGGVPLVGTVRVSGSKNAALPVIFASLTADGVSEIISLPDISDVRKALDIVRFFGARVERSGDVTYIDARDVRYTSPPQSLVSELRASTYLIGASLSRFGRAELMQYGGCNFSRRPIDMHIAAAMSFGADLCGDELVCRSLHSSDISFSKRSVGATVNSLIMAAGTPGTSRIYGYACEPHIDTLIEFLSSMGAVIESSSECLTVRGASHRGGKVAIPGDMIEAGTFLALSSVTGGDIRVEGVRLSELSSFISNLSSSGVSVSYEGGAVAAFGLPRKEIDIVTGPYPDFPTDLQPIIAPVLALGRGGSICDTVWEGRFGYLSELSRLGLSYTVSSGRAEIYPSVISSGEACALDLRGGAACIISALSAVGTSRITSGEVLLRGYERLAEKINELGGRVRYEK